MRLSKKRVVVAGLFSAKATDPDEELRLLAQRIEERGALVIHILAQRRGVSRGGVAAMDKPLSASTLIGKGKAQELAKAVAEMSADVVIFHNVLTGTQQSTLSKLCSVPVHDAPSLDLIR